MLWALGGCVAARCLAHFLALLVCRLQLGFEVGRLFNSCLLR